MAIESSSNDAQVARGPAYSLADSPTEPLIRSRVVGDAHDRLRVLAGGSILSGDGSAAPANTLLTSGENVRSTDPDFLWWSGGGITPVTVRYPGDGKGDAVFNLEHAGTGAEPYILHLGVNGTGGAAIGIGVSPAEMGAVGMVIDNYTTGVGFILQQINSISDPEAYGMYGVSNTTIAPLVTLVGAVASAAPLLQVIGGPVGAGRTAEFKWNAGASEGGWISALDGSLSWITEIRPTGGAPTVHLAQTGAAAGSNSEAYWTIAGQKFHTAAGSVDGEGNTYFYASAVALSTDEMKLQVANAPAIKGSESMQTVFTAKGAFFSGDGPYMAFFGGAPAQKFTALPANATDLDSAIALVNSLKNDVVKRYSLAS